MKLRKFKGAPAPVCSKYGQLVQKVKTKNYRYKVKEMLESQKGVMSEIIRHKSKSIKGFSLSPRKESTLEYTGFPLKFFEDQSYLERIAEWFTTAPFFLDYRKLKKNRDPVYRMKQVVKTVLSTLYMTVKPSKPFNPVLGETYQGFMCLNPEKRKS